MGDARLLEGGGHDPDLAGGAGDRCAISSATASPGALMPSSLVTRMRMLAPRDRPAPRPRPAGAPR